MPPRKQAYHAEVAQRAAPREAQLRNLDLWAAQQGTDCLVNVKEVAAQLGIGVSTVWRDCKIGTFPAPVYINPKSPRWRKSDIEAHIEAAPRTSPRSK